MKCGAPPCSAGPRRRSSPDSACSKRLVLLTTIAGSLPKPSWLAKPGVLGAPWSLSGPAPAEGKRDAGLVALREQGTAGIAIVADGQQAWEHFCPRIFVGTE